MATLSEGIRLALSMEEKGLAFYKECRAATRDSAIHNLFGFLVHEETKHKRVLLALQRSIAGKGGKEIISTFLGSKAAIPMFDSKDAQKLVGSPSLTKVLNTAIAFEEAGLHFYADLARQEKRGELKSLFLRLARDEQDHKETLVRMGKLLFE